MAIRAHSTRTPLLRPAGVTPPLLPPPGATPPLLPRGLGKQPGPTSTKALKARAAELRGALAARKKAGGTDPHISLRNDLIEAHAAAIALRPLLVEGDPETETYKAALPVDRQLWRLIREVLTLPAPRTAEGAGVVGLALAFEVEGALAYRSLENEDKLAAAARAILAVTGTTLPACFTGFGDEAAA